MSLRIAWRDPNPRRKATAELIQAALKEVGIDAHARPASPTSTFLDVGDFDDRRSTSGLDRRHRSRPRESIYSAGGGQNYGKIADPADVRLCSPRPTSSSTRAARVGHAERDRPDDLGRHGHLPAVPGPELAAGSDTVAACLQRLRGPTWNGACLERRRLIGPTYRSVSTMAGGRPASGPPLTATHDSHSDPRRSSCSPFIVRRLLQRDPDPPAASFLVVPPGRRRPATRSAEPAGLGPRQGRSQAKKSELDLDKPLLQRYVLWLGDIGCRATSARTTHGQEVWPHVCSGRSASRCDWCSGRDPRRVLARGRRCAQRRAAVLPVRLRVTFHRLLVLRLARVLVRGAPEGVRRHHVQRLVPDPSISVTVLVVGRCSGLVGRLRHLGRHRGDKRGPIGAAIGGLTVFVLLVGVVARRPVLQPLDRHRRARRRTSGHVWSAGSTRRAHDPADLTLALISFASYSRFKRASMLDTMSSDYVRTARAKGLRARGSIFRHALPQRADPGGHGRRHRLRRGARRRHHHRDGVPLGGHGHAAHQRLTTSTSYMIMAWLVVTAIAVIVFNLVADIALRLPRPEDPP